MQIPQGAGAGPKPAVQVVGFHVEGATPSPVQASVLHDAGHVDNVASSPTLVIIPPSFQSKAVGDAAPTGREASAGGAPAASAATQAPTGTDGAAAMVTASTSTTGLSSAMGAGSTPPASIPAPLHAPPAASGGSMTRPAMSLPKPIQEAERSEALHRGLVKVESTNSMLSEEASSMSTMSEQMSMTTAHLTATGSASPHVSPLSVAPSASKQPAAAAAPAAPAAAAAAAPSGKGGKGGPPGADLAPERKSQKEMTKAERRALQEAQRAAKAAAKSGGAPPPVPSKASVGMGAAGAAAGAGRGASAGGAGVAGGSGGGGASRPATAASQPARGGPEGGARGGAAAGVDLSAVDVSLAGSSGSGAAAVALAAAMGAKVKKTQGPRVVSLASTDLFTHLQQYKKVNVSTLVSHRDAATIHPAVLQLGLKYADGSIRGANARCVAMLHTFCQVISDYKTPEGKSLNRDLTQLFNTLVNFLVECRPLSVSMGNAIKHIKLLISKIDPSKPEADAKADLIREISDFINVRIHMADHMIVQHAAAKVDDGDVILTYAYSHVVSRVLLEAVSRKKRFRVVVVDARPEMEGRQMLQKLLAVGVACDYVHFNAMSYSLKEVTKVFLGAAAVMSNGTVMGRAGSAAVAMMAHALSKPVLICCESYKFHERVQLDSITHNELGDPDALASVAGRPDVTAAAGWQEQPRLGLLNLKFDAMPAEYVTMIVTEFGMIPPTSVPVILREYTLARQEA